MRVPEPLAQAKIDAINRRLDGLRDERRRLAERISEYDAEIRNLRTAREGISDDCEYVEVDVGQFGHSPFAGRDLTDHSDPEHSDAPDGLCVDCPEVRGDDDRR